MKVARLLGCLVVTSLVGLIGSQVLDQSLSAAPSLWVGNQLGLQGGGPGDDDDFGYCLVYDLETTGRCDDPYPAAPNYCDFIGCDQVKEDDEDEPMPNSAFHFCREGGKIKYSNNSDYEVVDWIPNDFVETYLKDEADRLYCTRPIICDYLATDEDEECKTSKWDLMEPDGLPEANWDKPLIPGSCYEPANPNITVGYCRRCYDRLPQTQAELDLISNGTTKVMEYDDRECLDPLPF